MSLTAAKSITELDIINAMESCNSLRDMAIYLRVHRDTLVKYCKLLIHSESGKSYFDLIKNRSEAKNKKSKYEYTDPKLFEKMLSGESTHINYSMLKRELIAQGYFDNSCSKCGFSEQNISTGEVPLVLAFNDMNMKNTTIDNLDIVCPNCYSLTFEPLSSSRTGFIKINGYV